MKFGGHVQIMAHTLVQKSEFDERKELNMLHDTIPIQRSVLRQSVCGGSHLQYWHLQWALGLVLAAPFPVMLPAKEPRKTAEDDLSVWTLAYNLETQMRLLASGFGLAQPWVWQLFGG